MRTTQTVYKQKLTTGKTVCSGNIEISGGGGVSIVHYCCIFRLVTIKTQKAFECFKIKQRPATTLILNIFGIFTEQRFFEGPI